MFLISELAGEKRFASTVAKRLESLVIIQFGFSLTINLTSFSVAINKKGALTHGDRRATESRDLSRFNIDNKVSAN